MPKSRENARMDATTNAGTVINIDFPRVRDGETWEVIGSSLLNSSGESVTVSIGLVDLNEFAPIVGSAVVGNGNITATNIPMFVTPGQFIRFTAKGSADKGQVLAFVSFIRHLSEELWSNAGGGPTDPTVDPTASGPASA